MAQAFFWRQRCKGISGSDIEATINTDYSTVNFGTDVFPNIITYFKDLDNHLIADVSFFKQNNFNFLELNGLTRLLASSLRETQAEIYEFKNLSELKAFSSTNGHFFKLKKSHKIYLPNCLVFGTDSSGNSEPTIENGVFTEIPIGTEIYVDPSMLTINNGGLEADLAYAETQGAKIISVENFNKPNQITDLSINICATSVQLNFTHPTGNTNNIDYYQVFANGFYKGSVKNSGEFIQGLEPSTSYQIEVKPVDVYYNKSTSNLIQITTLSNTIPIGAETETTNYKNRVISDGGIVIDIPYVDLVYKKLKAETLLAQTKDWFSNLGGIKYDTNNEISKWYNLSSNNLDANHSLGTKPILKGGLLWNGIDTSLAVQNSKLLGLSEFTLLSSAKGKKLNSLHRYQGFNGSTGYISAPYINSTYTPDHGFIVAEIAPVTASDEPVFALKSEVDNNRKHKFGSKFKGGQGIYTYFNGALTDEKSTSVNTITSNSDLIIGSYYSGTNVANVASGEIFSIVTIEKDLTDNEFKELNKFI